jgi:hypothetical protein
MKATVMATLRSKEEILSEQIPFMKEILIKVKGTVFENKWNRFYYKVVSNK